MSPRPEAALAALLVVGGVASLAAQHWLFVDPTTPEDWKAASDWTLPQLGERDRIMVVPDWRDDALTHFTGAGSQVLRNRAPLVEDIYKFERLFVVAEADRLDDAVNTLKGATVSETKQFGSTAVARLDVAQGAFSWELYDELSSATVSRVRGDAIEKCELWDKRKQRWDCGKRDRWIYVGQATREIGDEPRQCIWAHPLDGGRTLRIDAKVPPGKTLRVRDSFDLRGARRYEGAAVMMQVFLDDELVVEDRVAGDDQDWQAHDIDLSNKPSGAQMRIEIDLLGSIRDRFFCINAWTIPP